MSFQICCIGHITLDKVATPAQTVFMPGGTAYYFSHALAGFCKNYLLLTKLADSELPSVQDLEKRGIRVKRLYSRQTVFFENIYGANPDERWQLVRQQADAFVLADVKDLQADIFHLGPLLANDFDNNMIVELSRRGRVSLDVQGLLRCVEGEEVKPTEWKVKQTILPHIHFLKANEEEVKLLTGTTDVAAGAKQLADWGVREVVITLGSKGSIIYHQGLQYNIRAYTPNQVADATGCGDTYMAGYLYKRTYNAGIQEAGEFAAAMASLKLSKAGPFTGSEIDLLNILQTN